MDWTPHVTVAAIICDNEHFLLVEEQSDGEVVLNQPAGHWEQNETLAEAASREALEESAWHFEPSAITGIYTYTGTNQVTYLRVAFAGQHSQFEPQRKLDTGILRTVWMTREEVAQADNLRSPMVLQCIDDYLKKSHYALDLIQSL
ncbi:NUDIX hydrolase [Candidatus Albibeggiatoa sp. nov. NOAA]|uniref:NUDIX hydrolase n=1 Tax=Candidatus Albibeggiatoa sp. nov. NOAA TaxID=3162724 RepID=UPI0032F4C1E1|nr:NUDIX hydrolase [Thiotrichaceae bacterium]